MAENVTVSAAQLLRSCVNLGRPFRGGDLLDALNVEANTPTGRQWAAVVGEALLSLEDKGLVEWAVNPLSGDKRWTVTPKGVMFMETEEAKDV